MKMFTGKELFDSFGAISASMKSLKLMVSDKEIVMMAMEAGFSVSTAHGQEVGKLMPISDVETLRAFALLVLKPQSERGSEVLASQSPADSEGKEK